MIGKRIPPIDGGLAEYISPQTLLRIDESTASVDQAGLDLLMQGRRGADIVAITIAGKYRQGKSFLGSRCFLNAVGERGAFDVSASTNGCTRGVIIHGKPIPLSIYLNEIGVSTSMVSRKVNVANTDVIILDTEGLGDTAKDATHDIKLFTAAMLSSSVMVYNISKTIDEGTLGTMTAVAQVAEQIKKQDGERYVGPPLVFAIRDWALCPEDAAGNPITPAQFLEKVLAHAPGATDDKNKLRQTLRDTFPTRTCLTLARPVGDDEKLRVLQQLPDSELSPKFLSDMQLFRESIVGLMEPFTFSGGAVRASMLASMLEKVALAINKGAVPPVQDTWIALANARCKDIATQTAKEVASKVMAFNATYAGELTSFMTQQWKFALDVFEREHVDTGDITYWKTQISCVLRKVFADASKKFIQRRADQLRFPNPPSEEELAMEALDEDSEDGPIANAAKAIQDWIKSCSDARDRWVDRVVIVEEQDPTTSSSSSAIQMDSDTEPKAPTLKMALNPIFKNEVALFADSVMWERCGKVVHSKLLNQLVAASGDLSMSSSDMKKAQETIEQMTETVSRLESELRNTRTTVEEKEDLISSMETTNASREEQLASLRQEVESLGHARLEMETIRKTLEDRESEFTNKQTEMQTALAEAEARREEVEANTVTMLRGVRQKAKEQQEAALRSLHKLKTKSGSLAKEVDAKAAIILQLKQEIEVEKEEATQNAEAAKRELSTRAKALEQSKRKLTALNEQVAAASKRADVAERKVLEVTASHQSLEGRLSRMERENEQLQNKAVMLENIRSEMSSLKSREKFLSERLTSEEQRRSEAERRSDEARKELGNLQQAHMRELSSIRLEHERALAEAVTKFDMSEFE